MFIYMIQYPLHVVHIYIVCAEYLGPYGFCIFLLTVLNDVEYMTTEGLTAKRRTFFKSFLLFRQNNFPIVQGNTILCVKHKN